MFRVMYTVVVWGIPFTTCTPCTACSGCAGGSFFPRANGERDCVSTCETTRCGEVIVEDDYLKVGLMTS